MSKYNTRTYVCLVIFRIVLCLSPPLQAAVWRNPVRLLGTMEDALLQMSLAVTSHHSWIKCFQEVLPWTLRLLLHIQFLRLVVIQTDFQKGITTLAVSEKGLESITSPQYTIKTSRWQSENFEYMTYLKQNTFLTLEKKLKQRFGLKFTTNFLDIRTSPIVYIWETLKVIKTSTDNTLNERLASEN